MKTASAILSFIVGLNAVTVLGQTGQERDKQPNPSGHAVQAPSSATSEKDRMVASCLAIDNQAVIQIAQFAESRIKDQQLRALAEEIIRDHQGLLTKLREFAAEDARAASSSSGEASTGGSPGGNIDSPAVNVHVPRPSERRTDVAELQNHSAAVGHSDFIEIKREIAKRCVQSAEKELERKQGQDFDRCFAALQVFGHQHMLDTLKVLERHVSPRFSEALTGAAGTTEKHLQEAKEIAQSLDAKEGKSARVSERQPAATR